MKPPHHPRRRYIVARIEALRSIELVSLRIWNAFDAIVIMPYGHMHRTLFHFSAA